LVLEEPLDVRREDYLAGTEISFAKETSKLFVPETLPLHRLCAVNDHNLTDGKRGRIRTLPKNRSGDFFWAAHPSDRLLRDGSLRAFFDTDIVAGKIQPTKGFNGFA
jgi:hypothetical protein